MRFIDGFAGSAFLSVAGGTVSDVFRRDQIQSPMTIISLSPFIGKLNRTPISHGRHDGINYFNSVGPSLGPLLGGFSM